jgi:hypothetical protein
MKTKELAGYTVNHGARVCFNCAHSEEEGSEWICWALVPGPGDDGAEEVYVDSLGCCEYWTKKREG